MMIRVQCPSCRKTGRVPESAMNRSVLCPACGARHRLGPESVVDEEPAAGDLPAVEVGGLDGEGRSQPAWNPPWDASEPASSEPPAGPPDVKAAGPGESAAADRGKGRALSSIRGRKVAALAALVVLGLAGRAIYLGFRGEGGDEPAGPVAGPEPAVAGNPGPPAERKGGAAEGIVGAVVLLGRLVDSLGKPINRDAFDPVVSGSSRTENGVTTVRRQRKSGLVEVETIVDPPPVPQVPVPGPVMVKKPEAVPGPGTLEERFLPAPEGGAAHQGTGRGGAVERRVAPSMAWVGGKLGGGAGFLVRQGLVATTTRAITLDFATDLRVWFPAADGGARGPFPVALVAFDMKSGVALLAVHRGDRSLPPAFASTPLDQPPPGGSSGKLLGVKNAGAADAVGARALTFRPRVDVPARTAGLVDVLKTSEAGGPVIDPEGRALGLATMPHGAGRPAQFLLLEGPGNFLDRHGRDGEEDFFRAQTFHRASVVTWRRLLKTALYLSGLNAKAECRRSGVEIVNVAGSAYRLDEYLYRIGQVELQLDSGSRQEPHRYEGVRIEEWNLPTRREWDRAADFTTMVRRYFEGESSGPGEFPASLGALRSKAGVEIPGYLSRMGIETPEFLGPILEGRVDIDPKTFIEEIALGIR